MKFDINNYKGKYVMHCKTEEEAKEFCDYLHSVGRKWHDGDPYLKNKTLWYWEKEETCYNFNDGHLGNKKYYLDRGFTILEWSDFNANEFTKADLKDGMVVEYANGNRRLVLNESFIGQFCFAPLSDYTEDLREAKYPNYSINKIYKSSATGTNYLFDDHTLTLIWERKEEPEPVEMTIEEICKALGKEIKIVKG